VGDGFNVARLTPTQIMSISGVIAIAAGNPMWGTHSLLGNVLRGFACNPYRLQLW
jgi:hypothetical protein